jgi:hypothetical protein
MSFELKLNLVTPPANCPGLALSSLNHKVNTFGVLLFTITCTAEAAFATVVKKRIDKKDRNIIFFIVSSRVEKSEISRLFYQILSCFTSGLAGDTATLMA